MQRGVERRNQVRLADVPVVGARIGHLEARGDDDFGGSEPGIVEEVGDGSAATGSVDDQLGGTCFCVTTKWRPSKQLLRVFDDRRIAGAERQALEKSDIDELGLSLLVGAQTAMSLELGAGIHDADPILANRYRGVIAGLAQIEADDEALATAREKHRR